VVPKLFKGGKSFKSLAAYLLHDAEKAQTEERVGWTHTLNLASDNPNAAVDEMLWTFRAADWLKEQAGARAGGRRLDNPVRHFSLNWHPSENPSREHMVETVQSYMKAMGWQEHQALLVCHTDKSHAHVHVMVNAVHPETGRSLTASFERRWAQRWALDYEQGHDRVFCDQRLKPVAEREASPTREAWLKMKEAEQANDRAEYARIRTDFDYFARGDERTGKNKEWDLLKGHQRKEREDYFAEGKQRFKEVRNMAFMRVKREYRSKWHNFYKAKKSGKVPEERLKEWKEKLVSDQRETLNQQRDGVCGDLRRQRDYAYDLLLRHQRDARKELKERQALGLRTYTLLDNVRPPEPMEHKYRLAAQEVARTKEEPKRASKADSTRDRDPGELRASERDSGSGFGNPGLRAASEHQSEVERLKQRWSRHRDGRRSERD
jgi:hypothetical protein